MILALALLAQVVTHPTPLPDTDGDGLIVIDRAVTTPRVARGTVLIRCEERRYAVRGTPCPSNAIIIDYPIELPTVDGRVSLAACGRVGDVWRYAVPACPVVAPVPVPTPVPAPTPTPTPAPVPAPTPEPIADAWTPRAPVNPEAVTDTGTKYDVGKSDSLAFRDKVGTVGKLVANRWNEKRGNDDAANNVTIERVVAQCGEICVDFRRPSDGLIVRDALLERRGGIDTTKGFLGGVILGNPKGFDGVKNVVIERVIARNFQTTKPSSYPNADGFGSERLNDNITYRFTTASNNSDGGYDLKSTNTLLDNTRADENYRNYRLWGSGTGTTIYSNSPRGAHIWLGQNANYTINKLVATGGGTLVDVGHSSAVLTIRECDLTGWTGAVKVKGSATVTLGKGC